MTMKFDVLSVFPEFFQVLDLSLVGKAHARGVIDVHVHNLRDWTHDVHRTVDDAPFGGGAGMVMKPDVWAEAIDAVTNRSDDLANGGDGVTNGRAGVTNGSPFVLAIPTPSGLPLRQAMCEHLAQTAKRIVIACGRYEGIDARVASYYRDQPDVNVVEYSLGDYVLNGGEVAAVALIEAVSRLLPGMVGNPTSLVEESHGTAGLLEYPVYTRPVDFRGWAVPSVLTSGDHGAVARWRQDQALERTARRRPDMLRRLNPRNLDKKDLATLASLGYFVARAAEGEAANQLTQVLFRQARLDEAAALSALAARTFPDAAPAYISAKDIRAHIERQLQPENFSHLLADPRRNVVMVAQLCDRAGVPTADIVGYTWVIVPEGDEAAGVEGGAPLDFVTADGVRRDGPLMYLERAYLDRSWRGTGMFAQLMNATLAQLRQLLGQRSPVPPAPYLWLGTNMENKRAQRAYRRYGFERSGERTFYVGEQINNDLTMCLRLDMAQ